MKLSIPNDIIEYIDNYWKPNQDDSYIHVENGCEVYTLLEDWFTNHRDYTINVGPFVEIKPYSYYELEEPENVTEFVFIYDEIDISKLESKHLTIA